MSRVTGFSKLIAILIALCMFVLFYKDGRISENLSRPLSKYSRNQIIEFLDKYWKPVSVVDVEEDMCCICYETMTQETYHT